ncbi:hypothetical protein AMIKIPNL_00421 [Mycoplasmopsis arginini]|nr:hypothetical protein [Mycoplasmopsis arginini]
MKNFSLSFLPPTSVTVANSGLNPAIWFFSLLSKLSGIKSGKLTFLTPNFLNSLSNCKRILSQIPKDNGLKIIEPLEEP